MTPPPRGLTTFYQAQPKHQHPLGWAYLYFQFLWPFQPFLDQHEFDLVWIIVCWDWLLQRILESAYVQMLICLSSKVQLFRNMHLHEFGDWPTICRKEAHFDHDGCAFAEVKMSSALQKIILNSGTPVFCSINYSKWSWVVGRTKIHVRPHGHAQKQYIQHVF